MNYTTFSVKLLCGGSQSGCSGSQCSKTNGSKAEGGVRLTGREAERRLGQKKQNKGWREFFRKGNREGIPFKKQLMCPLLFESVEVIASIDFTLGGSQSLRCDLHRMPQHLILICCLSLSTDKSSFDHQLTSAFESRFCLMYGCLHWPKSQCLYFVFTSLKQYSDTKKKIT